MAERTEQELVRLKKLAELREQGFSFPNDVKVTATSTKILNSEVVPPESSDRYTIAGRLVQIRLMGKAAFAHLLDVAGRVQIYVRQQDVGESSFAAFKDFDLGDIVEVSGYVFTTKTGEKTLYAEHVRLLTKSLIPLPEKWHGLSDVEARYRQRYVDLIANPPVREVFKKRATIIREVRKFFDEREFLEVETPTLHYIAGGASARPFKTHHNTLNTDMVLRIALELPLKKLVVGGLDRVYELGRNFRNEGVSKKHNPEFTMLEFYQAYATVDDLMDITEELISGLIEKVCGGQCLTYGEKELDFSTPWARISMLESIYEIGEVDRQYDLHTLQGVRDAAASNKLKLEEKEDWGRSLEELWGEIVEPKINKPTFITQHPFSISPLARKNLEDPKVTDRFELIVAGMEIANGFSELNDAEDQRERFEHQAKRKAAGDEESSDVDEDFLRALEYGMPPTAGEGIGIDRLVMLLTDSHSIRDVVFFPQLKPLED